MTIKEKCEDVVPVVSGEAIPMVEASLVGEPLPITEAKTPPNIVRVVSPATLPEGSTFKAVVDGLEFFAKVPRGGVREGEIFETMYPQTIRVMAPATLSAGDRFEAAVDGVRFMATVPPGGVRVGEIFETLHPSEMPAHTNNVGISARKWRTGLFDCWDSRDFYPLVCMATCCNLCLHAQIIQRLNLTLGGCRRPQSATGSKRRIGACALFSSITAILVVLLSLLAFLKLDLATGAFFILAICPWFIFVFVAMVCTRKSMREQYEIPGSCCEDFCITYWCSCCSAIQMARHTHDPSLYRYYSCSPTGLHPDAPPCEAV